MVSSNWVYTFLSFYQRADGSLTLINLAADGTEIGGHHPFTLFRAC